VAVTDVLHVAWSGGIGGTERHVASLVRAAPAHSDRSHHVCFLDGRGSISAELAQEGYATALGVRSGLDVRGYIGFAKLLRRLRPSVIHFHTRNFAAHAVALLVLRSATRVYTEHAPGAVVGDRRFRLFYALFRRTTDAFVAIAPAMAECIAGYGVPPRKIVEVPHAVSIPLREQLDLVPAIGWRIGVVGRLERQKRIDLLLHVLRDLRLRGHDATAVIVGAGSQRDSLEALAGELGVGDVADFVGLQADVTPWLDSMDAFVMTSEVEPLGLTALEAMARGVPVVAMPCPGGLSELVQEGGRLAPSRNVAAMATVVEKVLAHAETRATCREAGLGLARRRTVPAVLARLDAIYTGVRARKPLLQPQS
jgi:glycosyltransferase involved in cell wall biosynthesis